MGHREDLLPTTLEGKIAKVVEEAGEVLQAIGKSQRHGFFAIDPMTKIHYDNRADLIVEMTQLREATIALEAALNNLPIDFIEGKRS